MSNDADDRDIVLPPDDDDRVPIAPDPDVVLPPEGDADDGVDEAGRESFPASDPPPHP